MSDQGAFSIPPQTFVECGLCKGNANISWFCKNCPTSLCNACATAHRKTKQYTSHTVVQNISTEEILMSDQGASSSIPPQTFVECGLCQESANISWFCKNCPKSLCDACATAHGQTKQYKSHTVVQRTNTVLRLFGPAKIAEQCQIHPEKDISSYCEKCDVPCCISCLVKNHQRHEISTIEDKYLDAEKRLNYYARQLDNDVIPKIDKMEDETKRDEKEENDLVEKVINDINDFRKDVIQNFNMSCDNLITEVKVRQCKIPERLKEIEKSKKTIESLKREIDENIERGKLDIIKFKLPNLKSLVPTLNLSSKVVSVFEPEMKILKIIKESVGKIHFREINVQKMYSFDSKIGATSMTTAGNNMAWVTYFRSPAMYLYNDKGKEVRSVVVKGSDGINDMAITQSRDMIVTCRDQKVRRVSVSGKVSTLIDTTPFGCEGVCVTDKQDIVVCMRDKGEKEKNHVAVYSPDGRSKLREIWGRDGQGKHLITNPYRVVQNDEDLCVVNYLDNVVCVDERDNVRWIYGGEQAKLEESLNPMCICVDKDNNLFVTDYVNCCVHYIDRDGRLIQVILTGKHTRLDWHRGICVDDSTGHVWVGNSNGYVVIAKYLQ